MENESAEMIPDETKKVLSDTFKQLKDVVEIEVYLNKEPDQYTEATTVLLKAIAGLTDKIKVRFFTVMRRNIKVLPGHQLFL